MLKPIETETSNNLDHDDQSVFLEEKRGKASAEVNYLSLAVVKCQTGRVVDSA